MTAEIIAEETSATVRPDRGLLPWNLGDYMEQPVEKVAPKMDKLQELLDVRAPHGESYREFYERWEAGLTRLMVYAEKHLDEYPLGVVLPGIFWLSLLCLAKKTSAMFPSRAAPDPSPLYASTWMAILGSGR